jgi:hypothetical protein
MLVPIQDLLDVVAGDPERESELTREVKELADELNSALPEYEVRLVHLDTVDYLEFVKRHPDGDEYNWAEDEADRKAALEELEL